MEFLESSNLSRAQHGLRRGLITVTQSTESARDIFLNTDAGNQTDAILIDFSKAFDTVLRS